MPPLTSALSRAHSRSGADAKAAAYAAFYDEVAKRQLREWLPNERSTVLDLSAAGGRYAAEIARAGHLAIHVTCGVGPRDAATRHDDVHIVHAGAHDLSWLSTASVDAVLAEASALSACLAVEECLGPITRVLRRGGRFMFAVDSLVLGLARLAEQGRWAELADVPGADVVLVPSGDGGITRCYWPEELRDVLGAAGLRVEWIRPRTVLAPETIGRALAADPRAMKVLVDTEVALEPEREGQSIGNNLVVAAVRD